MKAGPPPTAWRDPSSKLIRFRGEEYQCELAQHLPDDLNALQSITRLPQLDNRQYATFLQNNIASLLNAGSLLQQNEALRDSKLRGVAVQLTMRLLQKPLVL